MEPHWIPRHRERSPQPVAHRDGHGSFFESSRRHEAGNVAQTVVGSDWLECRGRIESLAQQIGEFVVAKAPGLEIEPAERFGDPADALLENLNAFPRSWPTPSDRRVPRD